MGKFNILSTFCVSSSLSHNAIVSVNQAKFAGFFVGASLAFGRCCFGFSRELEERRSCMINEWPCGIKTYITDAHSGWNDRCESRQVFSGGGHKKKNLQYHLSGTEACGSIIAVCFITFLSPFSTRLSHFATISSPLFGFKKIHHRSPSFRITLFVFMCSSRCDCLWNWNWGILFLEAWSYCV